MYIITGAAIVIVYAVVYKWYVRDRREASLADRLLQLRLREFTTTRRSL